MSVTPRHQQPARRVDKPEAGFFCLQMVKNGPKVPARIIFFRGKWSAEIMGKSQGAPHEDPLHAGGVFRVWHGGNYIDEAEYHRLMKLFSLETGAPAKQTLDTLPPMYRKDTP